MSIVELEEAIQLDIFRFVATPHRRAIARPRPRDATPRRHRNPAPEIGSVAPPRGVLPVAPPHMPACHMQAAPSMAVPERAARRARRVEGLAPTSCGGARACPRVRGARGARRGGDEP